MVKEALNTMENERRARRSRSGGCSRIQRTWVELFLILSISGLSHCLLNNAIPEAGVGGGVAGMRRGGAAGRGPAGAETSASEHGHRGIGGRPETASDGPSPCDRLEEAVESAERATVIDFPPRIAGKWVSESCEIRSGPEFLLRSYTFYKSPSPSPSGPSSPFGPSAYSSYSFRLTQYHYSDESCALPIYTITARGTLRMRGRSWLSPDAGAAETDYALSGIGVVAHSVDAAADLSRRINASCPGVIVRRGGWRPYREYVVMNEFVGGVGVEAQGDEGMGGMELRDVGVTADEEEGLRSLLREGGVEVGDLLRRKKGHHHHHRGKARKGLHQRDTSGRRGGHQKRDDQRQGVAYGNHSHQAKNVSSRKAIEEDNTAGSVRSGRKKRRGRRGQHLRSGVGGVAGASAKGPSGAAPWAVSGDVDCVLAAIHDATFHELQLMRSHRRPRTAPDAPGPTQTMRRELLLGDVHSTPSLRAGYRSTAFQTPLQHVEQSDACHICRMVSRATPRSPPHLHARPRLPALLGGGDWASSRCESRPSTGLFLRRRLRFRAAAPRRFAAEYRFYSDAACTSPTFTVAASGSYAYAAPRSNWRRQQGTTTIVTAPSVPGAAEVDFHVTAAAVTVHDAGVARGLEVAAASSTGDCGRPGTWRVGVTVDVTATRGCSALGIRVPAAEADLARVEVGESGVPVLLLGQPETEPAPWGTSGRMRPTAYAPPLVQCSREGTMPPQNTDNRLFPLPARLSAPRSASAKLYPVHSLLLALMCTVSTVLALPSWH
ncbi:protein APCDD1-like [Ischnura elegans]|uniref:protein APCDD1-like n=1 Tax=Ischnura elegans TaxID=197161 RepID=UPI001ED87F4D|nr:protein APCDD1-like [Ischnura elegans]